MKNIVFLFTAGYLVTVAISAKYPSELPRCKNADESCLPKVITNVIQNNANGHRGLHLIPYDPLKIKSMVISQDASSPVNIELKFSDVLLYGFKDIKVNKAKGFEKDLKTAKFEVQGKIPRLMVVGPYEITGQVLILPITGKGRSNMTLENVDAKLQLFGNVDVKKGEEYFNVNKVKFDFNVRRLYVHFENLFNGNRALGDNMNAFLNENWEEILKELKPAIVRSFSEILQIGIHGPFAAVPYKQLFLE